jgi:hypothetical protein
MRWIKVVFMAKDFSGREGKPFLVNEKNPMFKFYQQGRYKVLKEMEKE